jgi:hypothetical protein
MSDGIWAVIAGLTVLLAGGSARYVSQKAKENRQWRLEKASLLGYKDSNGEIQPGSIKRMELHMGDWEIHNMPDDRRHK